MAQRDPSFSPPAYLAAVAVGCLVVGALVPLMDVLTGRPPYLDEITVTAFSAILIGFLPGLLLCLPLALLGFWLNRRYGLASPVWYGLFGATNGFCLALAWNAISSATLTVGGYFAACGVVAGALAGLTYRRVERAEAASTKHRASRTPHDP